MCLLTTGIGSLSAQTRGTITATIVDQAGHPVSVHIVLKNVTSQEFSVFRSVGGTRGEFHYSISVAGPGRTPAPLTKYGESVQKNGAFLISRIRKTVAPGEAVDENVMIDRMFDMSAAGAYTITVSRPSPLDPAITLKSNTLAITVNN
jgi:hypothetical protein